MGSCLNTDHAYNNRGHRGNTFRGPLPTDRLLMLLLSCSNISRGYDATPLFEDVAFEIHAGERIGFVGPNGAGKTTLLKILAGTDEPDSGKVTLHAGARLGTLQQVAEFPVGRTLFDEAKSAFDELLATQKEFERTAEELAACTDESKRKQLSATFDRLSELLRHHDAFELDHKVENVLSGLGFKDADFPREVRTFSGGQQRRLLLAKLLLSAPDVMLLDEPSNHLDIATTTWLENYLSQQPEGMLVVSHDRYFLDRVTNKTFELHQRKITSYPGSFKQYVRLRDEKYERELKEYESQKEYVEKQEEYIRRAHYGQLAKQAQSRVKMLDKLERLEKPTKVGGPNIAFGEVTRAGDIIFHVEELTKRYGERTLFENLSFDLPRGKRLGIMGPNGCGKTTLLKILLGEEEPTAGLVQRGHLVFPGYIDQHLHLLDDEKDVIRAVWPEPDPSHTEQKMRDLLGGFGLHGETVEQLVKSLSGGERSRAALAKLTVAGANLLILDEPTNHLDIWACDSLEEALKVFEGTSIVVSHDRYFLNRVADLLIVFDNSTVEVVYGNYDTYELLRQARAKADAGKKSPAATEKASSGRETADAKPTKRKRQFPYRKVADLEADIAKAEAKIASLEAALQSPDVYKDATRVRDTMNELSAAKDSLAKLYQHWEEAVELNG
ncbi:MAG TPA: ABC-F family ATP-binding cassette domain-containing protein [Gemmataceae bacterium]|nr:ABC-F family ATP-binding cassette domain-containing protein [Gemmataceae bacterium]